MRFSLNLAGPLHVVLTITETSTAGLNSTMQIKVIVAPIGRIGSVLLPVIIIDKGAGTSEN